MTSRCRVVSGVVMALVMLGLPVAPVLCDLACPQAAPSAVASVSERTPAVAAPHASPTCHDATGKSPALAPATRADSAELDASPGHRCEHPSVLAPRGPRSPRVPERIVVAWDPAPHLSPFLAPHTPVSRLASTGAPSPPAAAAFSPVLRI